MSLPNGALLWVLLPFFAALLLTALFAFFYLRRYKNPYDTDPWCFGTSVFALTVVLITSALVPLDIFTVSFMKNPDGTFKEWAANVTDRNAIQHGVLYGYYAAYALVFVCIFLLIPFMYFFYEEKNEDGFNSNNRLCDAIKFTSVFVVVATILLLIGICVPLHEYHGNKNGTNETDWENELESFLGELACNKGEDTIAMVLSILSVLGMVNLIFYTGFGTFSWPMGLIRGTKSVRREFEEIQDRHLVNQTRINALKDKERIGSRFSARERRQLDRFEEHERQIVREEQIVDEHRQSLRYRLRSLIRPVEIITGLFLGLLAILIWVSLLITNIDKAMHSPGLRYGYALKKTTLLNPIDFVMINIQKVFPLDYIFIFIITGFLILCSISGIRNIGARVFGVSMYKLRLKRTRPQGLLLTCVTLMLAVLAFNIFLVFICPQYATYGNQHYNYTSLTISNTSNPSPYMANISMDYVSKVKTCPVEKGDEEFKNKVDADQCTMTQNAAILNRFFFKAPVFGAIYYWSSWAFIATSAISLLYVIIRKGRSVTYGFIDEDDLEESDDS